MPSRWQVPPVMMIGESELTQLKIYYSGEKSIGVFCDQDI